MAAIAVQAEVMEPAVRYMGSFLGGSLQRIAWQQGNALGYFTTGIITLGAAVGAYIVDGIGRSMMEGLASSGAAIAGWSLTGAFLLPEGTAARGPASRADTTTRALAQRMQAQLEAGKSPAYPGPAYEEEFEGIRLR